MRKMMAAFAAAAALAFSSGAQAITFDWQGVYVGGQGGYAWGDSEVNIPAYAIPAEDVESDGWVAGGFVGTDWALGGGWSAGVEADWNWTDSEGEALSGGGGGERYSIEENWNASVRARVGYEVMENTEIYAAAGWTWADVDTNYIPGGFADSNDTLDGWQVAAGVQHQYNDHLFTRAEVRYTDLDEGDFFHAGPSHADLDSTSVLLGIGWRFGN